MPSQIKIILNKYFNNGQYMGIFVVIIQHQKRKKERKDEDKRIETN
jgi:hypothetical protein